MSVRDEWESANRDEWREAEILRVGEPFGSLERRQVDSWNVKPIVVRPGGRIDVLRLDRDVPNPFGEDEA